MTVSANRLQRQVSMMYLLKPVSCFVFVVCALPCFAPTSAALATVNDDQSVVQFDVPAIVAVRELLIDNSLESLGSQKTIEIVIPVTTQIQLDDRKNVQEFRFNVFWNREANPLCDYGPKTQTTSEIDGVISVDKTEERNAAIGINLKSGYQDLLAGTGTADIGNRSGIKTHYNEIPQHEVLVASGTIHRGTGAFFRFHPSRTESLEGGRDLVVAFQVPREWRGGLLQVECFATGNRKVLAWNEPFEQARAFVVPVFLKGDDQAREKAVEFIRCEQRLRKSWKMYSAEPKHSQRNVMTDFQSLFVGTRNSRSSAASLPDDWVHYLIQSSDDYLDRYRSQMPGNLVSVADQFVAARKTFVNLSR